MSIFTTSEAPKFHPVLCPDTKLRSLFAVSFWNALGTSQICYKNASQCDLPITTFHFFLLKLDFFFNLIFESYTRSWLCDLLLCRFFFFSFFFLFFFNYVPLFVHLSWNQQGLIYNRTTIFSDPGRVWFLIILRESGSCQSWVRFLNLAKHCMQLN